MADESWNEIVVMVIGPEGLVGLTVAEFALYATVQEVGGIPRELLSEVGEAILDSLIAKGLINYVPGDILALETFPHHVACMSCRRN